ncbi:hypothetical protein CDD83_109 [Cordyceps sp. RAO-2017]|nr:hypothetical protein CDD83_109 [Cordyceps sp. RAO-2017]
MGMLAPGRSRSREPRDSWRLAQRLDRQASAKGGEWARSGGHMGVARDVVAVGASREPEAARADVGSGKGEKTGPGGYGAATHQLRHEQALDGELQAPGPGTFGGLGVGLLTGAAVTAVKAHVQYT